MNHFGYESFWIWITLYESFCIWIILYMNHIGHSFHSFKICSLRNVQQLIQKNHFINESLPILPVYKTFDLQYKLTHVFIIKFHYEAAHNQCYSEVLLYLSVTVHFQLLYLQWNSLKFIARFFRVLLRSNSAMVSRILPRDDQRGANTGRNQISLLSIFIRLHRQWLDNLEDIK